MDCKFTGMDGDGDKLSSPCSSLVTTTHSLAGTCGPGSVGARDSPKSVSLQITGVAVPRNSAVHRFTVSVVSIALAHHHVEVSALLLLLLTGAPERI